MANRKKAPGVLLFDSWFMTFSVLSNEDAGRLIKAIGNHIRGRTTELPEFLQETATEMFEEIDKTREAYDTKCEKLRANAKQKVSNCTANAEQMLTNCSPIAEQKQGKSNSKSKPNSKSNSKFSKENINKRNPSSFSPPELEEVEEYCRSRNNNVDPKAFIDFYTSKGWKVGNQNMKDWKAAVRTWENRQEKRPLRQQPSGSFDLLNYLNETGG